MTGAKRMEFDELELEMRVMSKCAQRFSGYDYISDTGFNVAKAVTNYFESGGWDITETELLAVFFLLQRGFNWGLAREPRHGMYFKIFRELFLLLAERDVPKAYRLQPCYDEWNEKYAPRLAEYLRLVRRIHRNSVYEIVTTLHAVEVFPVR
jgi:hypothetical protein